MDNASSLKLAVVERVAKELADVLAEWPSTPHPEVQALWIHPSQDTAALIALFSLALRQSSSLGTGDSPSPAYANIRQSLCEQFSMFRANAYLQHLIPAHAFDLKGFCAELLGPALLRADTLQCYCGLLAETAEQLAPTAAQLLPRAPGATASAPTPLLPDLPRVHDLLREPVAVLAVLGVGSVGDTPACRQLLISARDTI